MGLLEPIPVTSKIGFTMNSSPVHSNATQIIVIFMYFMPFIRAICMQVAYYTLNSYSNCEGNLKQQNREMRVVFAHEEQINFTQK